jgi:hypothetical protein
MSLRSQPARPVPEATAQVARAAFPKGCLAMRVRDAATGLGQDAFTIDWTGKIAICPRGATSISWSDQRNSSGTPITQVAVRTGRIRTTRYRGLTKTRLAHLLTAAALNLIRLDAWWTDTPIRRTRASHLARLGVDLGLAA